MKIGLISDTHSFIDDDIIQSLNDCDEIWHAGDIGKIDVMDRLSLLSKPLTGVYGNIDNETIRAEYPEYVFKEINGLKILMIHIAGRLSSYNLKVRDLIAECNPHILICGHSHILKVQYDKRFDLLYINPGAAGHHGFHHMRTLITFEIADQLPKNMNVIELGKRGRIK